MSTLREQVGFLKYGPRHDMDEEMRQHDAVLDDVLALIPEGVVLVTEESLAAALVSVGAADIDQMAWSPFREPPLDEGDPQEDDYLMASLTRAILARLTEVPA